MNPTQPPDPHQSQLGDGIHVHAHASGEARVHQAARDQHFHYVDGVRDQRRTLPGTLVRECPYPGLAAFEPSQARWFFGRDGLIAELISRLDQRLLASGIQMVIAPSGAGKSSLLRAGLLPRLDQAALPGSDQWPKLLFTPTVHPLGALAAHVAPLIGANAAALAAQLAADPRRCVPMLARALRERLRGTDPRARVVVVVDQFEELFTQCANDQHRRIFIEVLAHIAGHHAARSEDMEPVGLVVAGLRADFYASCADDPQLCAVLQDAPLLVGPMSTSELREAILFPARDVGLDLEPGLVELLLRDINATAGVDWDASYEAGQLPLLAHALRVSWHQRHGSTLTVQGYQHSGGIQHAIATTADQVYASLDDNGRRVARSLFLRLIKIGDGNQDTRRQMSRAELMTISSDPGRTAAVVAAFTRARLLTQQQDTVEITHDALLYGWPQLRSWIDTDRAGRLTHQYLEEAADAWEHANRESSVLYRGSRLEVARTWATSASLNDLSAAARAFLAASIRARRRTTHWRTGIIVVLTLLTLVAGTSAVVAERRNNELSALLRQQAAAALADEARRRGADSLETSRQFAVAAWQHDPNSPAAVGAMLLEQARQHSIKSAALAPWSKESPARLVETNSDGSIAAVVLKNGTVSIWYGITKIHPSSWRVTVSPNAKDIRLSDDGNRLILVTEEGAIDTWDVPARSGPVRLRDPAPDWFDNLWFPKSVKLSADGSRLAVEVGWRGDNSGEALRDDRKLEIYDTVNGRKLSSNITWRGVVDIGSLEFVDAAREAVWITEGPLLQLEEPLTIAVRSWKSGKLLATLPSGQVGRKGLIYRCDEGDRLSVVSGFKNVEIFGLDLPLCPWPVTFDRSGRYALYSSSVGDEAIQVITLVDLQRGRLFQLQVGNVAPGGDPTLGAAPIVVSGRKGPEVLFVYGDGIARSKSAIALLDPSLVDPDNSTNSSTITPDGRFLVHQKRTASGPSGLEVIKLPSYQRITTKNASQLGNLRLPPSPPLTVTNDERFLVTVNDALELIVLSIPDFALVRKIAIPESGVEKTSTPSLVATRDDELAVLSAGSVSRWKVSTGKQISEPLPLRKNIDQIMRDELHLADARARTGHPDQIFVTFRDGVELWDINKLRIVNSVKFTKNNQGPWDNTASGDSGYVAGDTVDRRWFSIWDPSDNHGLRTFPLPNGGELIGFAPRGLLLIKDTRGGVEIWDPNLGRSLVTISSGQGQVWLASGTDIFGISPRGIVTINVDRQRWLNTLCAIADRDYTENERRIIDRLPGADPTPPCRTHR